MGSSDPVEPAQRWAGRLFVGSARMVYAGPLGPTSIHAHHAYQLVLACSGPVVLADGDGVALSCEAAAIPANASHAIVEPSAAAVVVLVDPDDHAGRRLRALGIDARSVGAWQAAAAPLAGLPGAAMPATWADAEALAERAIRGLVGEHVRPAIVHPALRRVLRQLPHLLDRGDVRLDALSRVAGISASRLSHLFSEQVGISVRPYVLWLRLHRAAASLRAGRSITDAAHEAGFADGAHLSRVFRRMFGLAPSEIAGIVEWVPPVDSPGEPA
jgi:AraC-like DNA-binding protein